jgi:hypothetical protein
MSSPAAAVFGDTLTWALAASGAPSTRMATAARVAPTRTVDLFIFFVLLDRTRAVNLK